MFDIFFGSWNFEKYSCKRRGKKKRNKHIYIRQLCSVKDIASETNLAKKTKKPTCNRFSM